MASAAGARFEHERLVGRETELARLRAAAAEARTRAVVVLVRAEAGMGKSTLLRAGKRVGDTVEVVVTPGTHTIASG